MTREEEIRARLSNTTPGPWAWRVKKQIQHNDGYFTLGDLEASRTTILCAEPNRYGIDEVSCWNFKDADFIVNAPSDIDYLLKENKRLREALEFMARGYVAGDYTDMRQFARRTLDGEAE